MVLKNSQGYYYDDSRFSPDNDDTYTMEELRESFNDLTLDERREMIFKSQIENYYFSPNDKKTEKGKYAKQKVFEILNDYDFLEEIYQNNMQEVLEYYAWAYDLKIKRD